MQINGPALAAIRERSGLTQRGLASRTGSVSQGRISEIESQDAIEVRPATATALAEALSVPLIAIVVPNRGEAA